MCFISIENLTFQYKTEEGFVLNVDDLSIQKNSRVFLEGPSGCGKTTFLNLLTGLIKPNQGSITILGTDIAKLSTIQCDQFRADHFGIIFQLFNLLPYLNVVENIILPCSFSKAKKEKALRSSASLIDEAKRLCKELDIDDALLQKPVQQLSIGQQQRVAIARAIIGQPEIIVADEPTSALDDERKQQFMAMLLKECQRYNATLIFVSHDKSLKNYFSHIHSLNVFNPTCIEKS